MYILTHFRTLTNAPKEPTLLYNGILEKVKQFRIQTTLMTGARRLFRFREWENRILLNRRCFHAYAQKSQIIGENYNGFFDILHHTHAPDIRVHRAGSQLKICRIKQHT